MSSLIKSNKSKMNLGVNSVVETERSFIIYCDGQKVPENIIKAVSSKNFFGNSPVQKQLIIDMYTGTNHRVRYQANIENIGEINKNLCGKMSSQGKTATENSYTVIESERNVQTISLQDFFSKLVGFYSLAGGQILYKLRYSKPYDNCKIEYDIYHKIPADIATHIPDFLTRANMRTFVKIDLETDAQNLAGNNPLLNEKFINSVLLKNLKYVEISNQESMVRKFLANPANLTPQEICGVKNSLVFNMMFIQENVDLKKLIERTFVDVNVEHIPTSNFQPKATNRFGGLR